MGKFSRQDARNLIFPLLDMLTVDLLGTGKDKAEKGDQTLGEAAHRGHFGLMEFPRAQKVSTPKTSPVHG